MSEKYTKKWHLSRDGEYYDLDAYDSRNEAIFAGVRMYEDIVHGVSAFNDLYDGIAECQDWPTFYVGQEVQYVPSIDPDWIIENLQSDACDFGGEFAEDWLDHVTGRQRDSLQSALQRVFNKWMRDNKHEPNFFLVRFSSEIDPRNYKIEEPTEVKT